jgi:hypothetical protein
VLNAIFACSLYDLYDSRNGFHQPIIQRTQDCRQRPDRIQIPASIFGRGGWASLCVHSASRRCGIATFPPPAPSTSPDPLTPTNTRTTRHPDQSRHRFALAGAKNAETLRCVAAALTSAGLSPASEARTTTAASEAQKLEGLQPWLPAEMQPGLYLRRLAEILGPVLQ